MGASPTRGRVPLCSALLVKWIVCGLAVLALATHPAAAQQNPDAVADTVRAQDLMSVADVQETGAMHSFWTALRRLLLPDVLALMFDLREFLTELPSPEPRTRAGDLARLDSIYERALYLSEGNPRQALLALTWATLPYHRFPAQLPFVAWTITVPVSTESRSSFQRRLANLPGMLLADSPPSLDRDKLPHFFGSAWLQCVLNAPDLVDALGETLETMEEIFKLEGSRDARDIQVNRLGVIFAMQLQRQRAVRPSDVFLYELSDHDNAYHPDR